MSGSCLDGAPCMDEQCGDCNYGVDFITVPYPNIGGWGAKEAFCMKHNYNCDEIQVQLIKARFSLAERNTKYYRES